MVCCGGKPAAKEAPAAKKKAAAASGKPEKTVSADSTPAEVDETAQRIAEQLHGTKGIDDLGRRDATLTLHERVLAAANGEEKPEDAVGRSSPGLRGGCVGSERRDDVKYRRMVDAVGTTSRHKGH